MKKFIKLVVIPLIFAAPRVTAMQRVIKSFFTPQSIGKIVNWSTSLYPLYEYTKDALNRKKIIENSNQFYLKNSKDIDNPLIEKLVENTVGSSKNVRISTDPSRVNFWSTDQMIYISEDVYNQLESLLITREENGKKIECLTKEWERLEKQNTEIKKAVYMVYVSKFCLLHEKNHIRNNDLGQKLKLKPLLYLSGILGASAFIQALKYSKFVIPKILGLAQKKTLLQSTKPSITRKILSYSKEIVKGFFCGKIKSDLAGPLAIIYDIRKREQKADDQVTHTDPKKERKILLGGKDFFSFFRERRKIPPLRAIEEWEAFLDDPRHPSDITRTEKLEERCKTLEEKYPLLFF